MNSSPKLTKKQYCKQLFTLLLAGDIKDSNIIAAEMIITGYYLSIFDTIFDVWLKHIVSLEVLNYLINAYQQIIIVKPKASLKNNQPVRNIISQVVSIIAASDKTTIEYEDLKIGLSSGDLLKTIKRTISTNKPFFPLFRLLVEYTKDKAILPKQISDLKRDKKLEKLYHYFISRKSFENAALTLYVLAFNLKKPQHKALSKLILDKVVIQVNMNINTLYECY